MTLVADYVRFALWLLGIGYIVAWPPGLQMIGLVSASWVCLRLVLGGIARWRRARFQRTASMPAARIPATVPRPPRQKPLTSLRHVKPRSHFGLRGQPRQVWTNPRGRDGCGLILLNAPRTLPDGSPSSCGH
jgi:hypothetical protein